MRFDLAREFLPRRPVMYKPANFLWIGSPERMSSQIKARLRWVVATVLFALSAPATAVAGIEPPPSLMGEPSLIALNTQHVGLFLNEGKFGIGIEPGEPVTPGSGSICRP